MSEFSPNVVAKYGGTSMASPEVVASVVQDHPEQKVIVVSAPGKTDDYPVKMTKALFGMVDASPEEARQITNEMLDRFDSIYDSIGSTALKSLRKSAVELFDEASQRNRIPFTASLGETLSAMYMARMLGACMVKPVVCFDTTGKLDKQRSHRAIRAQVMACKQQLVVPGYYGYDQRRRRWLLGGGGSDRTQAITSAALGWHAQNWTDRNGIYTADPRIVDNAQLIPEITRREVREGHHGGTEILQGDSIVDIDGTNVVISIKNTFAPNEPGTVILPTRNLEASRPVIAVSGRNLYFLTIDDLGMESTKRYIASLAHTAADLGLSIEHLPGAAQDYTGLTFSDTSDLKAIKELKDYATTHSVSQFPRVEVNLKGFLCVTGEALKLDDIRTRISIEVQQELWSNGINSDSNGSTGFAPSLTFLTYPDKIEEAIKLVHEKFITAA